MRGSHHGGAHVDSLFRQYCIQWLLFSTTLHRLLDVLPLSQFNHVRCLHASWYRGQTARCDQTTARETRQDSKSSLILPFSPPPPYILSVGPKRLNAFHSNISMHILPTFFHTFPKVLTRRICLWSLPLFSWPSCLTQRWFVKRN